MHLDLLILTKIRVYIYCLTWFKICLNSMRCDYGYLWCCLCERRFVYENTRHTHWFYPSLSKKGSCHALGEGCGVERWDPPTGA